MASIHHLLPRLVSDKKPPGPTIVASQHAKFTSSRRLMRIPPYAWVLLFTHLKLGGLHSFDQASLRCQAKNAFSDVRRLPKPRANAIPLPIRQLTDEETVLLLFCVGCAQLAKLSTEEVYYDSWWLPANLARRIVWMQQKEKLKKRPPLRGYRASRGTQEMYGTGYGLQYDPRFTQVSGYATEVIAVEGKLIVVKKRIG